MIDQMDEARRAIQVAVALIGIGTLSSATVLADNLQAQPIDLRVGEDFVNPLGFYDPEPMFSWKLPPEKGITAQAAYQVQVGSRPGFADGAAIIWDSGRVDSDQSVWVDYGGRSLESREEVFWRVKFWDDRERESVWSASARIEMGLLSNSEWTGDWIEVPEEEGAFRWDQIKVTKAEYGSQEDRSDGVADVRALLQRSISQGKVPFKVDGKTFRDDPAPGKIKRLWVEYSLNGESVKKEFEEGETFDLSGGTMPAHPGYVFRKEFKAADKVVKARLYATALGIYEFEINGKRVGEDIMAPGWTSYGKRVETIAYDVTSLVHEGDNAIGALVGEGWYAGELFMRKMAVLKGARPKLLGQLELTYADGRKETVVTDASWKASDDGPILASGYYYGEDYDARCELGDWSVVGFDESTWTAVKARKIQPEPLLVPKRMATVREMVEIEAKSVTETKPGVFVFDFGQNLVGYPALKIPVTKDQVVRIRVAEMLEKDGSIYTENYRASRAQAFYTPAVDGVIEWQPSLTFFGFRYVEISGLPDGTKLTEEAAVANVIHTNFEQIGNFDSSHAKLNQLQSNIQWGQKGNFIDVPTDCPQRDERLGWTGDAQVFLPTSMFNYGVHSFWTRWLQSARDDQAADGGIPWVIPEVKMGAPSPGWADVIVTAPWEVYERTGNRRVLEANFEAMKRWVGVYERDAKNFITSIKGFGDWLQPYAEQQRGDTPMEMIATAYFGRDARILAWTAGALGREGEEQHYWKLHSDIRKAFTARFFDDEGRMKGIQTQTGYLMALGYDLVNPKLRKKVEDGLLESFEGADRHLRTGFLGTPLFAPVFDEIGHPEISYEVLLKESYPGWFYSINQGATTMWERWNSYSHADGFGQASMNSFNHYAYGAIGQWMYERVAGLSPDPVHPGYKHFFIRPLIDGPLESASAEYETPYGLARSAWNKSGGKITMNIVVPPNATATAVLPTKSENAIRVDGQPLKDTKGAGASRLNKAGQVTVPLSAGSYQFEFPSP